MQSNHPPTTKQKRVQQAIRDNGCIIPGFGAMGYQLHHIWGSSAKHNKIWIGQDAVLLLPWELHDVNSDHYLHVAKHPKEFANAYGEPKYLCILQYLSLTRAVIEDQYREVRLLDIRPSDRDWETCK